MSLHALGAYVRQARQAKKLSQRSLSQKLDGLMSQMMISKLENGHLRSISDDKLRALSQVLHAPYHPLKALSLDDTDADPPLEQEALRSARLEGKATSLEAWELSLLEMAYERLIYRETELMLKLLISMLDQRISDRQMDELHQILQ